MMESYQADIDRLTVDHGKLKLMYDSTCTLATLLGNENIELRELLAASRAECQRAISVENSMRITLDHARAECERLRTLYREERCLWWVTIPLGEESEYKAETEDNLRKAAGGEGRP
jgi:hypothetical protein